jgi:probable rRNA maturation factor
MKVIQVNQTQKRRASKDEKFLSATINNIILDLSLRRIRNRNLLVQKKELTVVFLTSAQMRKINFQFRRKNRPTDILSFRSEDPKSLGELLLCQDVLQKQAKGQKHSLQVETTYMLIHGILHLLGYDHELSVWEEVTMFRVQNKCFKNLIKK